MIQRLIEENIDRNELVKRKILCGNASNFQGDEWGVVFLSMVDSREGDGPVRLQSTDDICKLYNVTASRARDQLWVVDSLDSASDLKPGNIRKTLIDYSLNPKAAEIRHVEIEEKAESPFGASVAKHSATAGTILYGSRRLVLTVSTWLRCAARKLSRLNVTASVTTAVRRKYWRIWSVRLFSNALDGS